MALEDAKQGCDIPGIIIDDFSFGPMFSAQEHATHTDKGFCIGRMFY